jgi:multicomponent K+:H+ antiporter subunit A
MLIGAAIALFSNDLKALLAYSTVSHLGFLTMLFGFGTPMAAVVGVFHILNHATFKAALFMTAGIIDHEVGTRDARRLGGLLTLMPITATLGIVAAASMAGFPPLNGFLSKEMMLEEAAHTVWGELSWLVPLLATIAAMLSVAYSLRFIVHVFLGPKRLDYPRKPHDPPFGLWLPTAMLVVPVVAIGLFPAPIAGPLVQSVSGAVIGAEPPYFALKMWHGFTPALLMSALAILRSGDPVAVRRCRNLVDRGCRPFRQGGCSKPSLRALVETSRAVTSAIHNGSLQRYLAVFFVTAVVLAVAASLTGGGVLTGDRPRSPQARLRSIAWLALIAASAAVIWAQRRRYLALIFISVVGLVVALGFVHLVGARSRADPGVGGGRHHPASPARPEPAAEAAAAGQQRFSRRAATP